MNVGVDRCGTAARNSMTTAEELAKAGHSVKLVTGPEPELASRTVGFEVLSLLDTRHPNAPAPGSVRRRLRRVAASAGSAPGAVIGILRTKVPQSRTDVPDPQSWSRSTG